MLRSLSMATAIAIAISLLSASNPAFAQNDKCYAYCSGRVCGMSSNKNYCLNSCMQKCHLK
jgi:hypothetical protein